MSNNNNNNKNNNNNNNNHTLKFEDGAVQFRQRIAVSILSHKPLLIRNIRSESLIAPGLRTHEASFLRLIDKITNGSSIEINATGTQLRFRPGVLIGGSYHHDCPVEQPENEDEEEDEDEKERGEGSSFTLPRTRGIGWYIEGILPLAPFGKAPLQLTMTGITDGTCTLDPSPDYIRATLLPLLGRFGILHDGGTSPAIDNTNTTSNANNGGAMLSIPTRGAHPTGGGTVHFHCPMVRQYLTPIDLTDTGKVKRVRGIASSCRIPPSSVARAAHAAKGVLHRLLPDVWIATDARSSRRKASGQRRVAGGGGLENGTGTGTGTGNSAMVGCGISPSLSLVLVAESTSGIIGTGTGNSAMVGCGISPSLSLVLVAESTSGIILAAETCLDPNHRKRKRRNHGGDGDIDTTTTATTGRQKNSSPSFTSKALLPEDLGKEAAARLLHEIQKGGCVDSSAQSLALLLMCLCPEDVSRIRTGILTMYTVESLRLFRQAFGVEFKVRAEENRTGHAIGNGNGTSSGTVLLSCLGIGYRNMARAST
eukprot:CAMPEP_0184872218 /NCGR_PEP_ID=MMETSP0580-20130426/41158_1 /TAXON_ID=1118495 /ORGANISM="Dactyliosolen fragilissimus" /LENGTH=537 /DNA_ID=CAMNT_0027374975 /DNA_START=10 /DNA_END=1623 /DNA_ORIENTATION=+